MTSQRAEAQDRRVLTHINRRRGRMFPVLTITFTDLTNQTQATSERISPEQKLPATLISSALCASPTPDAVPPPPLFHSSSTGRGQQVSAAALFVLDGKPLHQTAPADWEHWLHFTPHQCTAVTKVLSQMSMNASRYLTAVRWMRRLNGRGSKSLSTAFNDFGILIKCLNDFPVASFTSGKSVRDSKIKAPRIRLEDLCRSFASFSAQQGFSPHSSSLLCSICRR